MLCGRPAKGSGSNLGDPQVAGITYDFGLAQLAAAQLSQFCTGRRIGLLVWLLLLLMDHLDCCLGLKSRMTAAGSELELCY